MNKEELLKALREENEAQDPYEREISCFSWKVGAIVSVSLCFVLFLLQWLFWGEQNFSLFIAVTAILAVKYIIEATKLRQASSIAFAALYAAVFIACTVAYIIAFSNGWL